MGSWHLNVGDYLTFPANTHDPTSDTEAADADSVPSYRIYEDETQAAILTGTMAKLDDANTVGFYSERIQLTAASGFEAGKCYTIYISATVNSITGTMHHTVQIGSIETACEGAITDMLPDIVDAILDEDAEDHDAAGSVGEDIHFARAGMANKQTFTFSGDDSGDIDVYDNAGEVVLFTRAVQQIDSATVGAVPK